jgi:formiminoglutamase
MTLFEETTRPNPELLYQRGDPNDVRLGETMLIDPVEYDAAEVVLLGFPQDEGVRRNKGRAGAAEAPDAIRRFLYRTVDLPGASLFDLGNTVIYDPLEAAHDVHRDIVRQVLRDGKTLIVLGGGNDISFPDCSALAMESESTVLAFNVDAHFDVRADQPRNSGTPYRQILETWYVHHANFYEIGYQPSANSAVYRQYLADNGVATFSCDQVRSEGLRSLFFELLNNSKAGSVFWGLDMDVVRASDAPGVSAPNPLGFTGEEFCTVAAIAGAEPRTRIFEISEVNPAYDLDDRTSRLAAAAIWRFLDARIQEKVKPPRKESKSRRSKG